MTRLSIATLIGLALAGWAAWQLEPTIGAGVLCGYLLGAALTMVGSMRQREALASHPERSLAVFAGSFLLKLIVLVLAAVSLRYVEALAVRIDWRGFCVAYAAAVTLVLPFGAIDAAGVLNQKEAH